MEPKKNPKADLSKNSGLYFAIGLAAILFITWRAIEHKTYEKDDYAYQALDVDEELDEEVPITEQLNTPPPPPPPPAPEVIEVVEDEEEVEETIIESTETTQDEVIEEVEDIEVEEEEVDIEVPFSVIEDAPIFPGCEKVAKSKRKACMSEKINKVIQRKFNTGLASDLGLSGRQRISVIFKIDKNGNITGVRARAPHPRLEAEAKKVVGALPKMTPGKQRGRAVTVTYSLPIVFKVED